jgi:hypothetical protein
MPITPTTTPTTAPAPVLGMSINNNTLPLVYLKVRFSIQ